MAKERMITRTITNTKVKAMSIDITTASVLETVIDVGNMPVDSKTILKHLNKTSPENIQYVAIKEMWQTEELYGMTESEFIKLAKVLPPR